MKTASIFAEQFTARTTGRRAIYTINVLSLEAIKIVLKGVSLKLGTEGAEEDCGKGYLRRRNGTGYYGGNDGFMPTAKGWKAILAALQTNEETNH